MKHKPPIQIGDPYITSKIYHYRGNSPVVFTKSHPNKTDVTNNTITTNVLTTFSREDVVKEWKLALYGTVSRDTTRKQHIIPYITSKFLENKTKIIKSKL